MKHFIFVLLLSGSTIAQTLPATRPAFTIGKDTTVVDGPLKPDGTIDYIPAINALLGKDIKNEDNAAIPILLMQAGSSKDGTVEPRIRQSLEALHATIPNKVDRLDYLSGYAARKKGVEMISDPQESQSLADLNDRLIIRPWKSQEQPLATEWIEASAPALKLAEVASHRSKFFIPFCVPIEKSAIGLDDSAVNAEPFASIHAPTRALLARALMRAGTDDFTGALADVRTVREIVRLTDQEHLSLLHLQSLFIEHNTMRACAGIAASGMLTRQQLATLRQEILALPVISSEDPIRDKVEQMIALDVVMQCIGGKSLAVMRLMAIDFSGAAQIDLSDWKNANWDVMLRETVRLNAEDVPGNTYLERSRNWEKKLANEPQGPSLLDSLKSFADAGNSDSNTKRINEFLKRREGESRDDYTRRITRWLMGADLENVRRNLGLNERPRTSRILALTAVALAEYRLANGAYPDSLDKLAPVPEVDGFTGKPLLYRRVGEGFRLWSAGLNQTDDGGTKDDLLVGTE